jgi:glutaredoxin
VGPLLGVVDWPSARGLPPGKARLRPLADAFLRLSGPLKLVTVYYAEACHLCERARATLAELRQEHEFELREVDIGGDADLEARYREWLPVVEIDGERAFVYYLDAAAFLRRLGAQSRA